MSFTSLARRSFPLFFVLLIGCKDDGVRNHHVEGTVTYRGAPLPAGVIVFTPDSSQGNRGPQGFAAVKKGRYNTAEAGGKGTIGGLHVAKISGYDGANNTEGNPLGRPLFSDYMQKVDLPDIETTLNLEVSAPSSSRGTDR